MTEITFPHSRRFHTDSPNPQPLTGGLWNHHQDYSESITVGGWDKRVREMIRNGWERKETWGEVTFGGSSMAVWSGFNILIKTDLTPTAILCPTASLLALSCQTNALCCDWKKNGLSFQLLFFLLSTPNWSQTTKILFLEKAIAIELITNNNVTQLRCVCWICSKSQQMISLAAGNS